MKIKILIFFLFKITSLFLSIKHIHVDDCITNIKIKKLNDVNNKSLFEYNDKGICSYDNKEYYQNFPYIKKENYEFGEIVYIDILNKKGPCSINIVIQLNELL